VVRPEGAEGGQLGVGVVKCLFEKAEPLVPEGGGGGSYWGVSM
jgi:hypothetical protein